jgi:hypothetical protein
VRNKWTTSNLSDEHKEITISYNPLNLPRRIPFDNGSQLDITYDAAGNKLKKQVIYPNGDRVISNLPIPSGTYTASGIITSTGRVDNGSNVTFKAGTAGFQTLDYNADGSCGLPNISARAMVKAGKIMDGTASSLTNKVGKL